MENTIRTFATPLLQAAGIPPVSVDLYIVRDNSLNAFVAGGQNIFMFTGLLTRSEHAGQVVGVLAHEIGHIAGGHLVRSRDAIERAQMFSVASMLLGAAAGLATGRPDAGMAVMAGGQEVAMRDYFSFSRTQESSADQAALSYLSKTGLSAKGLLEFFDILGDQEILVASRQDPYVRTHPLSRDRVSVMRHYVESSPHSNADFPPEWDEMHARMRAKLFAFLESPLRTFQRYREDDNSMASRYARAIAHYRQPNLDKALPLMDGLIAERPNDPYFHEMKAQILYENGRAREALPVYREAVRLLPGNPLLRVELARVEIELEEPSLLEDALGHLTVAVTAEPQNAFAWKNMAIAHGRLGNEAMASLAMAEHALLVGRMPDAAYHAGRAERLLPKGSPSWLRAQDVAARTAQIREERDK